MEILNFIVTWYQSNCNGDWEHSYENFTIRTLDNPGWSVRINLVDTNLENKIFENIKMDHSDNDWIFCKVENGNFDAAGDPGKLIKILEIFKSWAERQD